MTSQSWIYGYVAAQIPTCVLCSYPAVCEALPTAAGSPIDPEAAGNQPAFPGGVCVRLKEVPPPMQNHPLSSESRTATAKLSPGVILIMEATGRKQKKKHIFQLSA